MQYQGGKSKISKQITEVIHNEIYGWKEQDKQASFRNNRERERERDGKDVPKIHPAQKPVKLLKKLIKTFTDEGDVIIDPCCGSGTTLRAAHELNRNSYGFEIDRNFYTRAKDEMLNFKKESTDAENTNTIQKEI